MADMLSGLSNLSVFDGASDEARRRALINAGLAMMAPANPVTQGVGPTASLGRGVAAGLSALDAQGASEREIEQQNFQNLLGTRQAAAAEMGAEAQMLTAETGQQRAGTEAAAQAEETRQFDAQKELRDAKVDLDKAQAEWLRRRHDGSPAASAKVTTAMIESSFVEARMENLYRAEPEKYTLADGTKNLALLMDQAFLDLHRATGTAGAENVPIIAGGTQDAAAIGENLSALQGVAPMPAATEVTIVDQADLDAKKAAGTIKPGDIVIYNGQRMRVD